MAELMTVAQVAEHFGVSESRARAILAEYDVKPVRGYPADEVKQISRPGQGSRTDLSR